MSFRTFLPYIYVVCLLSQTVLPYRNSRLERRIDIIEQKVFYDAEAFRDDLDEIHKSLDNLSERLADRNEPGDDAKQAVSGVNYGTVSIDRTLLAVKRAMHVEKKNVRKLFEETKEDFQQKYTQQLNLTDALRVDFDSTVNDVTEKLQLMEDQVISSRNNIIASAVEASEDATERILALYKLNEIVDSVVKLKEENKVQVTALKNISLNVNDIRTQMIKLGAEIENLNSEMAKVQLEMVEMKRELENIETSEYASEKEMLKRHDMLTKKLDCHNNFGYSFGDSCYYVESEVRLPWAKAVEHCRKDGAYLVEINTEYENKFVMKLATKLTPSDQIYGIWVGGSDLKREGVWVWNDSQIQMNREYINFKGGQPDGRPGEHCLNLIRKYNWNWNDFLCENILSFICEKAL